MYKVVSVMSGTSLDGLDLCLCSFEILGKQWHYEIQKTLTLPYSSFWKNMLTNASSLPSEELLLLDMDYGIFIGKAVKRFLEDTKVDMICSHGHTVFHQPEKKLTLQIGNGSAIATTTGNTVINDFRKMDVLLGGQGAPLVPIGDKLLFPEYQACINLGGFSNISFENQKERVAFDICAVNFVLNFLCKNIKIEYDSNGENASRGNIHSVLLEDLNNLEYYTKSHPKSLGREWVEINILPLLKKHNTSTHDSLRTFVEHISIQIVNCLKKYHLNEKILFTGGGTKNSFLMQCISDKANCEIVVPSEELIDFKEALIFGFLGVLRQRRENNTLRSVTGAKTDSCGGTIHYPF